MNFLYVLCKINQTKGNFFRKNDTNLEFFRMEILISFLF